MYYVTIQRITSAEASMLEMFKGVLLKCFWIGLPLSQ